MRRRLLHLLAALWLMLCVAAGVLWVRSFGNGQSFGYYTRRDSSGWYRNIYLVSQNGRLTFVNVHQQWGNDVPRGRFLLRDAKDRSPAPNGVLGGFRYFHIEGRQMGWVEVAVPYWFVATLLATVPGWVTLVTLRRRRQSGRGFSLVSVPEEKREPEGAKPPR